MELKRVIFGLGVRQLSLLIVPYGIETHLNSTLILRGLLLIVPYGIETYYECPSFLPTILLIVPYGIETILILKTIFLLLAFNRTLWN